MDSKQMTLFDKQMEVINDLIQLNKKQVETTDLLIKKFKVLENKVDNMVTELNLKN